MNILLQGLLLGFSIAAPVGPIGVLCIRRTLQFGRWSGLFSGLGAAVADTFYAVIAAFGLTLISDFLVAGQFWLRTLGGLFLLYLGWKTFNSKSVFTVREAHHTTLNKDFLSTFLLTFANPMTILFFLAVFASLELSTLQGNYTKASLLVSGVFLGSSAWWLLLSEGIILFRKKITEKAMRWINRVAGLIIAGFGIATLISALF